MWINKRDYLYLVRRIEDLEARINRHGEALYTYGNEGHEQASIKQVLAELIKHLGVKINIYSMPNPCIAITNAQKDQ